ncbi:FHA domain-containing protein [Gorillibacterium sp. sgz5001074]|uniref:FHA domain-containing protein n=1 Tax=Gorillibacterium sp. sgz5001074 TaxID=3446695 RepID=UPI003F66EE48
MNRSYGLSCIEESRQGRYWVVRGDEAGPLTGEMLSRLDVRMMEKSGLSRLLALEVETVNMEVALWYKLPLGTPAHQFIRNGNHGLRTVLELLLSIVRILEDSRANMLDENKYALHPAWILVGRDTEEVHLMYLPLQSVPYKRSLRQEIYQLTLQLMEEAQAAPEECPVLLDCLKSSLFELPEFGRLLVGCIAESIGRQTSDITDGDLIRPPGYRRLTDGSVYGRPSICRTDEHAAEYTRYSHTAAGEQAAGSWPFDRDQTAKRAAAFGSKEGPEKDWSSDGDTLRFQPRGWTNGTGFRILLLLLAAVWGMVAWKPTYLTAGVGAGVTAISAAGYVLWGRRSAAGSMEDLQELDSWEAVEWAEEKGAEGASNKAGSRLSDAPLEDHRQAPANGRTFEWSDGKLYADTPAKTVFLLEPQETAQLPADTVLLQPLASLEYHFNGISATIELRQDTYLFGRCPEEADWLAEDTGISRKHGVFRRKVTDWTVTDLGSKNGTRLNGELLVSHREYPLQDGDRVKAAESEFIFRLMDDTARR